METYLVGGAVRDQLLGLPVVERDWVVVGGTPEAMTAQGFRPVQGGFPVFLHPETSEEYALARRETKQAPGYRGFDVDYSPDVTLEEDLRRRDLRINAMAEDAGGNLIDPYGGAEDLKAGLLQHVSPAFIEDPVRLLRIARFAAHLGAAGFRVAHDTHRLMKQMVESGELATLQADRIWQETRRALATNYPWRFFEVLHRCGALVKLMPLLADAMGRAGSHQSAEMPACMQALRQAVTNGLDVSSRWAVMMASLALDKDQAAGMINEQRVEKSTGELLLGLMAAIPAYARLQDLSASQLLDFCERYSDKFKPTGSGVISACAALYPALARPNLDVLMLACEAASGLNGKALLAEGLTGEALGQTLRARRVEAIRHVIQDNNGNR